jgi:ABC-2 type transport system permease protein
MEALVGSSATAEVWRDIGIVVAFAVAALAFGAATLRRRTP